MGANRVGKIYIELDLDKSRFMRSQQTLLKDATRVTLDIEKGFSKLGTKSDATFNLMRARARMLSRGLSIAAKPPPTTLSGPKKPKQPKSSK